jgi:hypothetical protein
MYLHTNPLFYPLAWVGQGLLGRDGRRGPAVDIRVQLALDQQGSTQHRDGDEGDLDGLGEVEPGGLREVGDVLNLVVHDAPLG